MPLRFWAMVKTVNRGVTLAHNQTLRRHSRHDVSSMFVAWACWTASASSCATVGLTRTIVDIHNVPFGPSARPCVWGAQRHEARDGSSRGTELLNPIPRAALATAAVLPRPPVAGQDRDPHGILGPLRSAKARHQYTVAEYYGHLS